MGQIRSMQSSASDARAAVRELHAGVVQPDTELVIFFCSTTYDLAALADEINLRFAGIAVVGCTTAGEIGPAGYRKHSLVGVGFPKGSCTAVTGRLGELHDFSVTRGRAFTQELRREFAARAPGSDGHNSFGLLLIDGLSIREEPVSGTVQGALCDIPLFGGSAGDDLSFARTCVFHDGAFHEDSAVLVLMTTVFPFRLFKTQHFLMGEERLVVTDADPARRLVRTINGLPAVNEYARVVGVRPTELDPAHFAGAPVLIDGTDYVRSIRQAQPDGSLLFYCAIETGMVLRIAHGGNLMDTLERTFTYLHNAVGHPQLVLACDCILRNLEISQKGLKPAVETLLRANNTVGFNTYGEQYYGVHVNQTMTGIAFAATGEKRGE